MAKKRDYQNIYRPKRYWFGFGIQQVDFFIRLLLFVGYDNNQDPLIENILCLKI